MDILDILISLLIVGGYLFFNIKKRTKKEVIDFPKENEFDNEVYEEKDLSQNSVPMMRGLERNDAFFSENEKSSPLKAQYDKMKAKDRIGSFRAEQSIQNVDNELEIENNLSFEIDDLKKAVIYSEVLKMPYN